MNKKPTSYADAGVDVEKSNALVNTIKGLAASTQPKESNYNNIGSFGAVFEIPSRFKTPLLVSGTDGVGTKLKLGLLFNQHHTLGVDLVAMCVNDIICHGAEPLFFLDYYATGALDTSQAHAILSGIVDGCQQANMALVGGETAEMPGVYKGSEYDLAGFAVGAVEKNQLIEPSYIQPGNILIAISSSGAHANGFSLIQKIIDDAEADYDILLADGRTLQKTLLTPTKIYVQSVLTLLRSMPIQGIAHITGGGLLENIPRVLAPHTQAVININSWRWPALFSWLQKTGNVSTLEMYRTFNLGVGMVLALKKEYVQTALRLLEEAGEHAWIIGGIQTGAEEKPSVTLT